MTPSATYDAPIMAGQMPPAASTQEIAEIPPGHSYYIDARKEGLQHDLAARRAARYMGSTLQSVASIRRRR